MFTCWFRQSCGLPLQFSLDKLSFTLGSWYGTVGGAITCDTRGPGFESSHRQFLSGSFIFYLLGTKDKNKEIEKEKETVGALFKIRNCNLPFRTLRFKPCGSYVTRRQILLVTIQYNLHLCLALKLKWFFSCFVTFKTACSWPLFIYFASFSYTQHKSRSELEPYELRANS